MKLPPEFLILADKSFSGAPLSDSERALFEKYLIESPEAAKYCASLGIIESMLPAAAEQVNARRQVAEAAGKKNVVVFSRLMRFGAAAVLALGIGLGFALNEFGGIGKSPVETASGNILKSTAGLDASARVTQTVGVQWTRGQSPVGAPLAGNSGEISAGLLELTLGSGVRILLEGPASFTVTGKNACRLHFGKAVVDVPTPAIGFVMEGAGERIVDYGTRFAVNMGASGKVEKLGVLSGVVDIERPDKTLRLFTDYAVENRNNDFTTATVKPGEFYREMPTREYPWEITREKPEVDIAKTLDFDLTPLIHGPGGFRVVFKWLRGWGKVYLKTLTLRRDGKVIFSSKPDTEAIGYTVGGNNSQLLVITPEDWQKGKWTLSLDLFWPQWYYDKNDPRHLTMTTEGVLYFAEGISVTAGENDFLGKWQYMHKEQNWIREFLPDGTVRFYVNGQFMDYGRNMSWKIEKGLLAAHDSRTGATEYHMVQEDGTLVFLNKNYRNAHRVTGGN